MIRQLAKNNMILPNDIASRNEDNDDTVSSCNICDDKPADIFQIEGDYCLDCWQNLTYPNL
jgi:hypothetical protein